MATEAKPDYNLTNAEFGDKLARLAKHHNTLLKLAAQVYALKKTQRVVFPDGDTVGRKELRTLSSVFAKELRGLKRNYTAHGKRPKRKRNGGSAGFKNPILVTENMRAFFAEANLGNDPRFPGSPALNTQLAVGSEGVTTRAILTPLFNIYAHVNNMQKDPAHRQFLTSTPQMDRFFAQTYANLAARPARVSTKGEPIPQFDPRRFRYASIQSIIADNSIPKEQLSPEQVDYLKADATVARLAEEQALVSGILKVYRDQKKAARKAQK
jgi:hypothetical protein